MKFIRLTAKYSDKPVLINVDAIEQFGPCSEGTWIHYRGDEVDCDAVYKESFGMVEKLIHAKNMHLNYWSGK